MLPKGRKARIKAASIVVTGLIIIFGGWSRLHETTPRRVSRSAADSSSNSAVTSANHNLPNYRVQKVVDGDTIELLINGRSEKIRLIGMDTPEVVDPRKVVQCFGREASAQGHKLLDGQTIQLETDPQVGERDKYGRLLAYIILPDGQNYGLKMIQDGYAHEYTYQSQPYKYQAQFKASEVEARDASRGLWAADTCNGNTTQPAK